VRSRSPVSFANTENISILAGHSFILGLGTGPFKEIKKRFSFRTIDMRLHVGELHAKKNLILKFLLSLPPSLPNLQYISPASAFSVIQAVIERRICFQEAENGFLLGSSH
jgi:hypothetical protein